MNFPLQENSPLYNSRITKNYIKLIQHKYGYINVNDLLRSAGIEPFQVEDEGHWFTQKQINLFHKRLQELTGNKNIAREAGLYSASPEALGGIRQYIVGLANIATAYRLAGEMSNKFTRSSVYTSRKTGPEQVEVVVTPKAGIREEFFQCESRKGYLESIAKIFNYKLPKIEHPECIFKGGKSCRYIVTWKKSHAAVLKRIRNIAFPVLTGIALLFSLIPGINLPVLWIGTIAVIAMLSWYADFLDIRELRAAVDSLSDSSNKLIEQTNRNYNNALMINEIGVALHKESGIDGVLEQISSILQKRLDFDRGLVMLADHGKTRLEYRAGYGYTDEQLATIYNIKFELGVTKSKGIFTDSFESTKPVLLNNLDDIKNDFTQSSYEFVQKMGVETMICCPILYEDTPLGILAVENTESKRPLLQSDINLLMGVATQIGSRIHNVILEEQLRQTQKMEAVGILAGGVAHDFNNILTTIIGYSEIISSQLDEDHPFKDMVESIFQASEKAAALTRQLLAFSRKQVLELKVINLNVVVDNLGKMLNRMIGEDIKLELLTGKQIGNIKADVGQVEQVLMNLTVNARDAMPSGGILSIETSEGFLDEKYASTHRDVIPGKYAILAVTDTGEGMSSELQEKIFEPFFTTKETGKGTGLGLATVYGIVKQLNGHIYVHSETGKGSTFKIYFPVIDESAEKIPAPKAVDLSHGKENILIVDDDASIRRLVIDTLEPLGYKLFEAKSGEDAMEITRHEKIDLLLSDVIMPGMKGKELAEKLNKERPEIKTILMSGYTDNIIARQDLLDNGVMFINKPLRPISLANKIRSVLDNADEK